jgi:hypothetical protein
MPAALQPDIIYRVATLESVTGEAHEELERILVREVTRGSSVTSKARGGTAEAAKIMNNTTPGHDQRIMKAINKMNKGLAQAIQDEMFIFNDFADVDEKSLPRWSSKSRATFSLSALKGAEAAGSRQAARPACRAAPRIRCATKWKRAAPCVWPTFSKPASDARHRLWRAGSIALVREKPHCTPTTPTTQLNNPHTNHTGYHNDETESTVPPVVDRVRRTAGARGP